MSDFLAILGFIALYAFFLFVTVGIWLIGAAALLKWLGLIT